MLWALTACRDGSPEVHATALSVAAGPYGSVTAVAALELRAEDRDWGGWSGASLRDGTLTAVSDLGRWMTLHLDKDPDGKLIGVSDVHRGALLDQAGRRLDGKREADAEAIAADPSSGWVVAFERHHRLLRYPTLGGRPTEVALPPGFAAPDNGGIEAFGRVGDGWLAIVEGEDEAGPHPAWVGGPGRWEARAIARVGAFRPAELAPLPDGDSLLVERSWSRADGVAVRLTRLPAGSETPVELGILRPPDPPTDNFEAAAVDADGIYLLSDDNQASDQRTILLQVRLGSG